MIRWLIIILVIGGLGGGAYWWFTRESSENPLAGPAMPKTSEGLSDAVVVRHDGGYAIQAGNMGDAIQAMGLCHGHENPRRLLALRDLFRGVPKDQFGDRIKGLAELFYMLDFEQDAQASLDHYTPQMRVLLERYAIGLSQATKQTWDCVDVLMMQRGYAFLLGDNFAKEWREHALADVLGQALTTRITGYPTGTIGGYDTQILSARKLDILFEGPLLAMVRRWDPETGLRVETRAHPALAFVFQAQTIQMGEERLGGGITLAGTPFFWAGGGSDLTYAIQPRLRNDEHFYQVSEALFTSRPGAIRYRRDHVAAEFYSFEPATAAYGREITPLISGPTGMTFFYYWDGQRPSADLTTLFLLMTATSLDEAYAALQHHRTPGAEVLVIGRSSGERMVRTLFGLQGADPEVVEPRLPRSQRRYDGPEIQRRRLQRGVQGLDFAHAGEASDLDAQLGSLLAFYLDGPMASLFSADELEALSALQAGDDVASDYFQDQVWAKLSEALNQAFFEERNALKGDPSRSLAIRRLILQSLARDGDDGIAAASLPARVQLLEGVVRSAWSATRRASRESPAYGFVYDEEDESTLLAAETAAGTWDGVDQAFWPAAGSVYRVATLVMLRRENGDLQFEQFPFVEKTELGGAEPIMRDAREYRIRPAN